MSGYLPALLDKVQNLISSTQFFLSSIPNVDNDLGKGLARQLTSSRDLLTDLRDYTLLSKDELRECVDFVDSVLLPLQDHLSHTAQQSEKPEAAKVYTGAGGRPRYEVDLERALQLHDMGNTWTDISKAMGVCRKTLFNHLEAAGLSKEGIAYAEISDEDLDQIVATINANHPLSGSIMVRGHLLASGLKVQLERVRDSLRRVDEEGVLLRCAPRSVFTLSCSYDCLSCISVLEGRQDAVCTRSEGRTLCGIKTEMRSSNHGVSTFTVASMVTPAE